MKRVMISFALGTALLLSACAGGPPGTPFSQVAESIPAVPAGEARIFFYRDYEPYESLARPWIYLNNQRVGMSVPGGVYYRDVTPGTYRIKVDSEGLYWHQFKTVTLAAGETAYAKIESLRSWDEVRAVRPGHLCRGGDRTARRRAPDRRPPLRQRQIDEARAPAALQN